MATNLFVHNGSNEYGNAFDIVFGPNDLLRAEQNTISEFWAMGNNFEPIFFELPRINPVEPCCYIAKDWLKEWHENHPPIKPTDPIIPPYKPPIVIVPTDPPIIPP